MGTLLFEGETLKYLSIDIEATGLAKDDLIIEFAMVPFDTLERKIESSLERHFFIQCPPFEKLKSKLDPWVIEHNEDLIKRACKEGLPLEEFKKKLEENLTDKKMKNFFQLKDKESIVIFGKSLNAIDLPFLTRDLGWDFMRKHFHHHVLDLTSVVYALVNLGYLPPATLAGSELAKYYKMGDIAHTALEDARNMATVYMKILDQFS